jgi:hypothetical protein
VTPQKNNDSKEVQILSAAENFRYFKESLNEVEIINVMSDLKHRIFPRPFERLSNLRMRENLVGAEIGVAGGEHALSLLETLSIKRLYLIDPYDIYETYTEGKLHYGADGIGLNKFKSSAEKLLSRFADRIVWVREMSSDAANLITEELDFVYVDGNHAEDFVRQDINNFFPKLSSRGVIGGHDFYNGFQREHDGVVRAVLSSPLLRGYQMRVEVPDWWVEVSDNIG